MKIDYTVNNALKNNQANDFGKHIKVQFLWDLDLAKNPVYETTLAELKEQRPEIVQRKYLHPSGRNQEGYNLGKRIGFG